MHKTNKMYGMGYTKRNLFKRILKLALELDSRAETDFYTTNIPITSKSPKSELVVTYTNLYRIKINQ